MAAGRFVAWGESLLAAPRHLEALPCVQRFSRAGGTGDTAETSGLLQGAGAASYALHRSPCRVTTVRREDRGTVYTSTLTGCPVCADSFAASVTARVLTASA